MGLGPAPFCGRKTNGTLHHSSLCIHNGALTSTMDISGGVPPLVLHLESRTVSRSCHRAEAVTCSSDGYDFSDCRLVYLLVEKRGCGGRPQIHLLIIVCAVNVVWIGSLWMLFAYSREGEPSFKMNLLFHWMLFARLYLFALPIFIAPLFRS